MKLAGVLETVVYCATADEEATRAFYRDVLEMTPFGQGSSGHRVGPGVFLLFNRDVTATQDWPPPHGAVGPVHTCFLAAPGEYEQWKAELEAKAVELVNETTWDSGLRSFYFEDPAGNMLEIAEGDLWPND